MIRPLNDRDRVTWNLEQPGARITTDLQAENGPRRNLRVWAVTDRVVLAQSRAQQRKKATA